MILYKNTKVKVRSSDGDTDYFDIVAGAVQWERTPIDIMKEDGFRLAKEKSRRYPANRITDADYADDIALLTNTSAQAETLLHSLEWAAAGIGLHVNADKTEYMCFYQRGDIF